MFIFFATPFLKIADFALQQTGTNNLDKYIKEVLYKSFYVYDCLKSMASVRLVIQLTKDLREVCTQKGFNLTKWVNNSKDSL